MQDDLGILQDVLETTRDTKIDLAVEKHPTVWFEQWDTIFSTYSSKET